MVTKKMILHCIRKLYVYIQRNSWIKKVIGGVLCVIGLIAFVTPLTPGSWIAIIGLELLGVEILSHDVRKKYKDRIILFIKKILS